MKNNIKVAIASTVFMIGAMMNSAVADDKAVVQAFYDLLSNPASQEHAAAFKEATADNWESVGDYSGKN